jgi:fatty acid desaturase
MTRRSRARRSRAKALTDDQRRKRLAELVLILCVIAYLGLAVGIMYFLPGEPWLSWILLLFAVHTAGYLVVTHVKEKRSSKSS